VTASPCCGACLTGCLKLSSVIMKGSMIPHQLDSQSDGPSVLAHFPEAWRGPRVVVCRFRFPENVHVVVKGFVKNMDEWMGASDCIVTKAGPGKRQRRHGRRGRGII
jgi:hypothetical protein